MPWLQATALGLGCFLAGLFTDWFLRRLDGSRGDARKALGMGDGALADSISQANETGKVNLRPKVLSILTTAEKSGLWVPPLPMPSLGARVRHSPSVSRKRGHAAQG
jgi:hypothetical protein